MAKTTKPAFNWKLPGLALGVGLIALLAVGGDDSKPAAKKPPKKSSSADDKNKDIYVKSDYTTFFKPAKLEIKDSFRPLVAKAKPAGGIKIDPNGLDATLTGGESWVFTGTPEVDGVRTALLENTVTGQGVYLKVGEAFRQMKVMSIEPDQLVVRGNDGADRTVHLADATQATDRTAVRGAVAPVTPPPLRGPIGSNAPGVNVPGGNQPAANAAADMSGAMDDSQMQPQDFNGGGRRNRRRRGN